VDSDLGDNSDEERGSDVDDLERDKDYQRLLEEYAAGDKSADDKADELFQGLYNWDEEEDGDEERDSEHEDIL